MTDTYFPIKHASDGDRLPGAIALLHRAAIAMGQWQKRRAQYLAIRELRKLSDRTLKDIGLHRSQIVSEVMNGSLGDALEQSGNGLVPASRQRGRKSSRP